MALLREADGLITRERLDMNVSEEGLHTLRTFSNIEVPEKKLLTCILLAEPRLLRRLQHSNCEASRGRSGIRRAMTARYRKTQLREGYRRPAQVPCPPRGPAIADTRDAPPESRDLEDLLFGRLSPEKHPSDQAPAAQSAV